MSIWCITKMHFTDHSDINNRLPVRMNSVSGDTPMLFFAWIRTELFPFTPFRGSLALLFDAFTVCSGIPFTNNSYDNIGLPPWSRSGTAWENMKIWFVMNDLLQKGTTPSDVWAMWLRIFAPTHTRMAQRKQCDQYCPNNYVVFWFAVNVWSLFPRIKL